MGIILQDTPSHRLSRGGISSRALHVYEREISEFLNLFPQIMSISPAHANPSQFQKYMNLRIKEGMPLHRLRLHRVAIQRWHQEQKRRKLYVKLPENAKVFQKKIHVLKPSELDLLFHNFGVHVCGTLLRLIYASGLRLEEALQLCSRDINIEDMEIYVRDKHGSIRRKTIFSHSLKNELQSLKDKVNRPMDFVFSLRRYSEGRKKIPLSRRTPQLFLDNICKEVKIQRVKVGAFRDNFALSLLRRGIDRHHIAKLMGYRNVQSMLPYQHHIDSSDVNVNSPLDTHQIQIEKEVYSSGHTF